MSLFFLPFPIIALTQYTVFILGTNTFLIKIRIF